jgi:hypothetical protein
MLPIKVMLRIENEVTSEEYLSTHLSNKYIDNLQLTYSAELVKLYTIFLKDKKLTVQVQEDKAHHLDEQSSGLLLMSELDKYFLWNLSEKFINQFEINLTSQSNITYYQALIKAKDKVNNIFEEILDNNILSGPEYYQYIPIIKLIDYKYNNGTIYILPDKLMDTKSLFKLSDLNLLNDLNLYWYQRESDKVIELNKQLKNFQDINKITELGYRPLFNIKYPDTLKKLPKRIDFNIIDFSNLDIFQDGDTLHHELLSLDIDGNIKIYKDVIIDKNNHPEANHIVVQKTEETLTHRLQFQKNTFLVFMKI